MRWQRWVWQCDGGIGGSIRPTDRRAIMRLFAQRCQGKAASSFRRRRRRGGFGKSFMRRLVDTSISGERGCVCAVQTASDGAYPVTGHRREATAMRRPVSRTPRTVHRPARLLQPTSHPFRDRSGDSCAAPAPYGRRPARRHCQSVFFPTDRPTRPAVRMRVGRQTWPTGVLFNALSPTTAHRTRPRLSVNHPPTTTTTIYVAQVLHIRG